MNRKKLFWQLYPSYLVIILFTLVVDGWYVSRSLTQFHVAQTERDLEAKAKVIQEYLAIVPTPQTQIAVKNLGAKIGLRITLIEPNGKVIADSEEDPQIMDNHRDRPEVMQAFSGNVAHSRRFSHTLQQEMLYTAIPVLSGKEIKYVLRTSIALPSLRKALRQAYTKIILSGLTLAVVAAGLGYFFSRRVSRPLEALKERARRLARGENLPRLKVSEVEELAALGQAMEEMAQELDQRINAQVQQSAEKEAILGSMIEGVLALDRDQKVISMNSSAARLFGTTPLDAHGRSLQELIRNSDLQEFVRKVAASLATIEEEIVLPAAGDSDEKRSERFLQVHGSALKTSQNEDLGVLIVLNDLTRLRRLERVRKDFVANVSHELKTPITSIKGFIETLLDGAYQSPEDCKRFLEIVARHTDRLNAIIEDLLSLSRIEQEETRGQIALEDTAIAPVLSSAIQSCESKAHEKSIRIEADFPEKLSGAVNAPLLEQALVNLVDNAIKYSPPKKVVFVRAFRGQGEILIQVEDQGVGIPEEHLSRIFERFYRVDASRSRNMGGTGLGLAIVKHIIQAHHGRIEVQSRAGTGSTFTLHLPANT